MTESWRQVTWGLVSDLRYGKALSGYRENLGRTEVFGTNGPVGWTTAEPLCSGPRPIVGRKGAYRGVHLASGDFWVIDTAYWLEPTAELDPTWAYYALLLVDINGMDSGSAIPSLTRDHFRAVPLKLPPIDEQRRIASVLTALDALIHVNRALMAEAAELISTHFRKLMSTAEVTETPLLEAFDVDFGAAFKGDKFSQPGVGLPLLRIRDLKTHSSGTWTTERIKGDVLVRAGDVVIGMDAEFRPTYWLGPDSLLNQRVCRVRFRLGSPAFVRESLVKPMAFIEGHKTGTTVSHLNKADLDQTKVAIPDAASLERFDAVAEPLRAAIVALHNENLELASARDELLPLLMSGRVRVEEDVAA